MLRVLPAPSPENTSKAMDSTGLKQVGWSWCPVLEYAVRDVYGHHGAARILCDGSRHSTLYVLAAT